jgi:hypothetical protein
MEQTTNIMPKAYGKKRGWRVIFVKSMRHRLILITRAFSIPSLRQAGLEERGIEDAHCTSERRV